MPLTEIKQKSQLVQMPIIKPEISEAIDQGYLIGYAATWHEDSMGERFQKGAFSKTIKESIGKHSIPLMVKHAAENGEIEDTVGVLTDAKEDNYGLLIWGKWYDDEKSQEIRKKVVDGIVDGLSVGYQTIKAEGKTIKEARLIETTITVKPANVRARILDAKSLIQPEPLEKAGSTEGENFAWIKSKKLKLRRLKNANR